MKIRREDITEVVSHEHVILQCMDIILGAMAFRLNDRHLEKQPGTKRRGKRTIAKEKLYKHIPGLIRNKYSNFNIGITSKDFPREKRWDMSYRYRKFTTKEFTVDESKYK